MYAIKIIGESYTSFHLAEEINYSWLEYKNGKEFWKLVDQYVPDYQIGDSPTDEDVIGGRLINLTLYKNSTEFEIQRKDSQVIFVIPMSWVYIMQDGKTIEVINNNVK